MAILAIGFFEVLLSAAGLPHGCAVLGAIMIGVLHNLREQPPSAPDAAAQAGAPAAAQAAAPAPPVARPALPSPPPRARSVRWTERAAPTAAPPKQAVAAADTTSAEVKPSASWKASAVRKDPITRAVLRPGTRVHLHDCGAAYADDSFALLRAQCGQICVACKQRGGWRVSVIPSPMRCAPIPPAKPTALETLVGAAGAHRPVVCAPPRPAATFAAATPAATAAAPGPVARGGFVLNRRNGVYHRADCPWVVRMGAANRVAVTTMAAVEAHARVRHVTARPCPACLGTTTAPRTEPS